MAEPTTPLERVAGHASALSRAASYLAAAVDSRTEAREALAEADGHYALRLETYQAAERDLADALEALK